jgi:hypothetical protein
MEGEAGIATNYLGKLICVAIQMMTTNRKMDEYFVVIICMILLITVLRMARERYVEKLYAEKFHAIEDDDNYRTYVQNYLRVQ